jgi:hypothetical protein
MTNADIKCQQSKRVVPCARKSTEDVINLFPSASRTRPAGHAHPSPLVPPFLSPFLPCTPFRGNSKTTTVQASVWKTSCGNFVWFSFSKFRFGARGMSCDSGHRTRHPPGNLKTSFIFLCLVLGERWTPRRFWKAFIMFCFVLPGVTTCSYILLYITTHYNFFCCCYCNTFKFRYMLCYFVPHLETGSCPV